MNKIIKIATFVLFMLLLVMPWIYLAFPFFKVQPINENRKLATLPEFSANRLLSPRTELQREYETWFNDHYGMRDFFIRSKNQIDYTFFHTSRDVIIGSGDRMFYKSEIEQEQVIIERKWEQGAARLMENMVRLNDYFKARGMTLIVFPVPQKNSVYPEWVPSTTAKRPPTPAARKYAELLKSSGIPTFDLYSEMIAHKNDRPLFYNTDFHWSSYGEMVYAPAFVNYLAELTGTPVKWTSELKFEFLEGYQGGLNNSLSTFFPPSERGIMCKGVLGGRSSVVENSAPYLYKFTANNLDDPALLPKTVFFGDSFMKPLMFSDLPYYFRSYAFIHIDELRETVDSIDPDTKIVVIGHIENSLQRMLSDPDRKVWWPDLDKAAPAPPEQP